MAIKPIDDEQLKNQGAYHSCLDDVPQKSATEMKEFMDYLPRRIIIPKVNEIIENVYTKQEYEDELDKKANVQDIYTKNQTESMFLNLLKGKGFGNPMVLDDVSPYSHNIDVFLSSKNIIPFPYYDSDCTVNGITYTVYSDGGIHMNGTATASSNFVLFYDYVNFMPEGIYPGEQYTLSLASDTPVKGCYLIVNYYNEPPKGANYLSWINVDLSAEYKSAIFPQDGIGVRAYINVAKGTVLEDVIVYPQLEMGDKYTSFSPYNPYTGGMLVQVQKGEQVEDYYTDSEGKVYGIPSFADGMNIVCVDSSQIVNCEYSRDITKAFYKLEQKMKGGS